MDTLKEQHQELVHLVRQMDVMLERGDEAGARAVLSSLAQALRDHLMLEDRTIYPRLIQAADLHGNPRMRETATLFASNMERITGALQEFTSRHASDFHLERFKAGWRTISGVLAARISSEKKTLYPLYEQRVGASALGASSSHAG